MSTSMSYRERLTQGLHHYSDWYEGDTMRLIDKACALHEEETARLCDLIQDQDRSLQSLVEWQQAFVERTRMPSGEFAHLPVCSGDRQRPPGSPGCVCDRRYRGLEAMLEDATKTMAEYREEIRSLKEELRETKGKERKAMSLFRAAIAQNKTPTP